MDKKKIYIMVALLLAIGTISLFASIKLYPLCKLCKAESKIDGENSYISLQHETNPLLLNDKITSLEGFKEILSALTSTATFDYYEIYSQPLDVSESEETFYPYSESLGKNIRDAMCLQISENVQKDFSLDVNEGRLLKSRDFQYQYGKHIPVVMGASYRDKFKVGDTFKAEYLFSSFSFKVVGFFCKDANIRFSSEVIPLNEYIVMPSVNFLDNPSTEHEYVTQKIHYANKTSGTIKVSSEEYDNALIEINTILDRSNVGDYAIGILSTEKLLGFNPGMFFVLTVCIGVLSAMAIVLITICKLRRL